MAGTRAGSREDSLTRDIGASVRLGDADRPAPAPELQLEEFLEVL